MVIQLFWSIFAKCSIFDCFSERLLFSCLQSCQRTSKLLFPTQLTRCSAGFEYPALCLNLMIPSTLFWQRLPFGQHRRSYFVNVPFSFLPSFGLVTKPTKRHRNLTHSCWDGIPSPLFHWWVMMATGKDTLLHQLLKFTIPIDRYKANSSFRQNYLDLTYYFQYLLA